jgi:maltooligosyltrehalose trehalohydrolase
LFYCAPFFDVCSPPFGAPQASFRVWAPQATSVSLEVVSAADVAAGWSAEPTPPEASGLPAPPPPAGALSLPLQRCDDGSWAARVAPGALTAGAAYRVALHGPDGAPHARRDPYARVVDPASAWCTVVDAAAYEWVCCNVDIWTPPPFAHYNVYELHIGSFTQEGTLIAAIEKLQHVHELG